MGNDCSTGEGIEIYAVKVDGFSDPVGFRLDDLSVSWKVRGAEGARQTWSSVEVALDPEFEQVVCAYEGEDLDSLGVVLEMEPAPRTRYWLRIRVRTDAGEEAVSDVHFFETGKLGEPWEAEWLGIDEGLDIYPEFQKEFAAKGPVVRARLYICGLGLFEAYVNGEKAGDDLLAPFINDYQEHFQYCTYDVTDLVRAGAANELSVALGKGWYLGRYGLNGDRHAGGGDHYALIAELRLDYEDGTSEVVGTDGSWRYRQSIFELGEIYDGETQDWPVAQGERPWNDAVPIDAPGALTERYSPPLETHERLPVAEVIHTPKGETVLDFGQNLAGYVECTQSIPAGATLTIEFGEVLQEGCFYNENYRSAKSTFTYVSDGEPRTIRAHFTFFGFRYARVTGVEVTDPSAWTSVAVYSSMDRTGYLTTGNAKVNRLHENTVWGLKSNFVDLPTDCPQRDERLGWCGDAQVFCKTAGYLMDTRAFYSKFLRDLRSDQVRCDGAVATYLPNESPGEHAAVWSDVASFMPHMLYTYYGSEAKLADNYPLMRDWVECVHREDVERGERDLWDFGFQFGDWVALDGATEQSFIGRTDPGYIASCYYYGSTMYTAEAAEVLGLADDAERYRDLAGRIRQAIMDEYFTPNGRLAIDTQTGYIVALCFGLYPDKDRVTEGFRARVQGDLRRIKGGFVGATMMCTVLAENGMADLAYEFLLHEGFPGWLYEVDLGATTIWERWNSLLPDGSISGTGMNSLNHYSYGSVVEFLYRHAAGIAEAAPGFRRAVIEPKVDVRISPVTCSFDSAAGRYVSNWEVLPSGELSFHIEVPFGCTAEVRLPEQEPVEVGAGSYDYVVRTERDYRCIYTGDTQFEQMLDDDRAVAVLDECLPGITDYARGGEENATSTLEDLRAASYMHVPGEAIDAAEAKLGELRMA